MKIVRLLLALILSVSVPVTTLAATVNLAQCEQRHALTDTPLTDPGHSLQSSQPQGVHAQHMAHNDNTSQPDLEQCSHCKTGHCASGSAGALASGAPLLVSAFENHAELIATPGSRTAPAHSLVPLRPPSLI